MTAPDRSLVALAVIAFVEGALLVAYAVFDLVEAIRVGATGPQEVSNVPAIVLLIVITAAFGAGMVWVGLGWWRARRWARAPFILGQLIGGLVGVELAQSEGSVERGAGIALVLVAILGLVLAFSPAANRALGE